MSNASERTAGRTAFSTESDLMDTFKLALNSKELSGSTKNKIRLHELGGLQGRADMVDAQINALPNEVDLNALATALKSPANSRLLAVLKHGSPLSTRFIERATGFSQSSLKGRVRQLELRGLIKVHGNSAVSLGCPLPWSMVDMEAYECKLSNWRRALHQAIGYRSFSRTVWVVMPTSGARCAMKLAPAFHTNGIGLISVADNGSMHVEIRSKKRRRPASRRIYLTAVGAILSKFLEKRKNSDLRIGLESAKPI